MPAKKRHTIKVEVSADEYAPIVDAAEREGLKPGQWIARQVVRIAPTRRRLRESMKRLLEITEKLDAPAADNGQNDAIDRDLAREYGSDQSNAA